MNEMVEFYREKGIRGKYNGRGPGTFIEQLLLDLGFAGTEFLVDIALNEGVVYERHFGAKDKEKLLKALQEDRRRSLRYLPGETHRLHLRRRPRGVQYREEHRDVERAAPEEKLQRTSLSQDPRQPEPEVQSLWGLFPRTGEKGGRERDQVGVHSQRRHEHPLQLQSKGRRQG